MQLQFNYIENPSSRFVLDLRMQMAISDLAALLIFIATLGYKKKKKNARLWLQAKSDEAWWWWWEWWWWWFPVPTRRIANKLVAADSADKRPLCARQWHRKTVLNKKTPPHALFLPYALLILFSLIKLFHVKSLLIH